MKIIIRNKKAILKKEWFLFTNFFKKKGATLSVENVRPMKTGVNDDREKDNYSCCYHLGKNPCGFFADRSRQEIPLSLWKHKTNCLNRRLLRRKNAWWRLLARWLLHFPTPFWRISEPSNKII